MTADRLEALDTAIAGIDRRLDELQRATLAAVQDGSDRVAAPLQQAGEAIDEVAARVVAIERRLEDTQGLLARARDDLAGIGDRITRARARADYAEAWGERPLITVRVPTYQNGALLTERTLPSLLRQTYEHWECVIVGDAITDDTAERIARLGDDRIRFENLAVRGPYPEDPQRRWFVAGTQPMNAAAAMARGAWIAPLDDDDEFDEDHLEVLLARARETQAEFVYGQLRVRDGATGELIDNIVGAWPPRFGHIGMQGAMYHAAFQREGIVVDPHAWLAGEPGDWNFVRRLWEGGARFGFVDRPVTTYYYLGAR